MSLIKKIYKIYKKYNSEESFAEYTIKNIGQIILALFFSFLITCILCLDAVKTTYLKYNSISKLFYTDDFDNMVWGIIFICLPMFIAAYMVIRLRIKNFENRLVDRNKYPILNEVTLILGMLLATLILKTGGKTLGTLPMQFILKNDIGAYFRIFLSIVLITLGAVWEGIILYFKNKAYKRHISVLKLIYILLVGIMGFYLVELQMDTPGLVEVNMVFFNIIYWMILYYLINSIIKKPKLTAIICIAVAYVVGLSNYCILQFRGNYIMFGDLTVVGTAMEVAGRYKFHPNLMFFVSLVSLLICISVILFLPKINYQKIGVIRRISGTIIRIGLTTIVVIITFYNGLLYNGIFGLSWNYNKNVAEKGYLPYFLSNMRATRAVEVVDYTEEEARKILEEGARGYKSSEKKRLPTIIVIQNETFADLSVVSDIKTDKPIMPYIDSLKENTMKGYLNMSVTGGPTANTEFEFLLRSSMIFMPTGSVPYTQYVKQNIPSIVEVLKNQSIPYKTVAFHPYYSSGYNRMSVYDYLGFDEKVFYEKFSNKRLLRGLCTDENDYEDLIKMYEKNKKENSERPQFFFNVTMQNHGGYSNKKVRFDEPVEITNFDSVQALDNFESLIRTSDTALEKLISYFSKVDEPVIILFYGDHQPSFSNDAKKQLEKYAHNKDKKEFELSKFIVPYLFWANYDIPEYDEIKKRHMNGMSVNFLGSLLLKYSGVELSKYDEYLLNLHEKIPAISALGLWDRSGKYYDSEEESPFSNLMSGYEKIQYNLIFDAKEKMWDLFLPKERSK